jgi:hypothetical protein
MRFSFKLGAIVTSLSIASVALMPSSALAVPGWEQTYRRLAVSTEICKNSVQNAIRKVTGSEGTFEQVNGTTYLMTAYPQGTTGVFFSDRGSGEAAKWRDLLDRTTGFPQYIDCA